MSVKTEIFSRTVGSAEFPTDLSPQTAENIGRTTLALMEPLGILEATINPYPAHETSSVMADSNNGSSDGGSCGHCSSGNRRSI